MKRLPPLLLALALSGALTGCSPMTDYLAILRGNRLHELGRYEDAAAAYISVRHGAFKATVEYDLADVYARLGETAAASELYARARRDGYPVLRADAYFNEGVALYERGRYEEAWRSFRSALVEAFAAGAGGNFVAAARRNLELSWSAWRKRSAAPPQTVAPSSRIQGSQDDTELRLLRRLETGRWKPGTRIPSPPSSGDY